MDMKKLEEMTLEELWQLFPIQLTEHQDRWADDYAQEAEFLRRALPRDAVAGLHHIGSTAIRGIWAKPIVDILLEVAPPHSLSEIRDMLTGLGYRQMSEDGNRISLNKGYTESGFAERVFHLHLRLPGDCDELYFRDYMNARPALAKEYEALKLSLWKRYEHDRDGYTDAKTEFITKHTQDAKRLYPR